MQFYITIIISISANPIDRALSFEILLIHKGILSFSSMCIVYGVAIRQFAANFK